MCYGGCDCQRCNPPDEPIQKVSAWTTGRTTRQMQQSPIGAVYIWCNNLLDYPKRLADKLGRSDLKIVGPEWLENGRWKGVEISGLDIDHAARLTTSQMTGLDGALPYIRRSK